MKHCLQAVALNLVLSFFFPVFSFCQLPKIFLQPKAPGNAKQSKFVDSIHFIPLEIKDNINLESYSNLQIAGKYFVLIDYGQRYILLYERNGRFVKKVSYKKLGDSFYPQYKEESNDLVFFGQNKKYSLTTKDRIKIKLDWQNPKNKKYFSKYRISLNDSTFLIKKDLPDETDLIEAFRYYDNYYWQGTITTSPLFKTKEDYEIKIYKDNKLVKKYFPYDPVNEPRFLFTNQFASFSKTNLPSTQFVFRPFSDTIYKMVKDSLFPAFQVVMPMENSLPPSFFTRPFKNKTERENFTRNNGWMFSGITSFFETPEFYYFSVRFQTNYEAFIYQKQGNSTYKAKSVRADSSQYNLQLLSDFNVNYYSGHFYKAIKAGDLIKFFDQNKNAVVPKELQQYLGLKPHTAAPIIVEYKLKETP
jgi:hypothetical protein